MTRPIAGVLVIDKPAGPTSHDVVQRLRRTLGVRRVGHAGTLDPAATGVMVVLVGEATKLEPFFSACDKAYVAEVLLGRSTDTLDLEGATVGEAELDAELERELLALEPGTGADAPRVEAALAVERARTEQIPPSYSAIKVDGRRSHAEARAGRPPELAARPVRARTVTLTGVQFVGRRAVLTVRLEVSKGYYVRSFARDLGRSLGLPAMLVGLRRDRSGSFGLDRSTSADAERDVLCDRLISIEDAAATLMPLRALTAEGLLRARQGKRLAWEADVAGPALALGERLALVSADDGAMVAVAIVEPETPAMEPDSPENPPNLAPIRVVRGFVAED